jgi:hypothetical protein
VDNIASMSYIKYILLIVLFASCQSAWAFDENEMRARDMQQLEQSGPVKGSELHLADTLNDLHGDSLLVTKYLGFQASADKINNNTDALNAGAVKLTRRHDLDCHGLSCFDTVNANGMPGRVWIDLNSERQNGFLKTYMYKTWAILALTP